jgi:hypothetical protein
MRPGFIAAVVAICAACTGGLIQVGPASYAWAHYQSSTLGFDHPPEWKERPQRFIQGTLVGTIAILSTRQPDQDLCYRRSILGGSLEEGCDSQRLGKLAPGDVVLIVGSSGMPGVRVLPPGVPLVVDGHDATLSHADQNCAAAMRGDKAITLTILQSPNDWITLNACGLKVPDLEQTMRRLAASTRITPLGA